MYAAFYRLAQNVMKPICAEVQGEGFCAICANGQNLPILQKAFTTC